MKKNNNRKHCTSICRLCLQNKELKKSHIAPKLFFKFIKRNSPTGRFRSAKSPEVAMQDGEKTYFLCGECEEKFSKYETFFSSHLYQTFIKGYGIDSFNSSANEINYFILSVAWRALKFLSERSIVGLSDKEYQKIDEVLEEWRKALYDEDIAYINNVKQYIIPTARLGSYFCQKDFVYNRDMTSKIISNVCADFKTYDKENEFKCAFTTVQVPYLIFVTMVWGNIDGLEDYSLGKVIVPRDFEIPKEIRWQLDYFHRTMFKATDDRISNEQKEEILKRALKKVTGD